MDYMEQYSEQDYRDYEDSKVYDKLQDTIENAKNHLDDIISILYSDKEVDCSKLDELFFCLCDELGISFRQHELLIQRKLPAKKPLSFIESWKSENNQYLKQLAGV